MKGPVDAGRLDRRAVLEEDAGTLDAMGGRVAAWRDVAELSVRLEPTGASERERFDRREGTLTHRVTLRHRTDVRRGMAFRLGDRRMAILTVEDPDERGRWLVCRCEEEA